MTWHHTYITDLGESDQMHGLLQKAVFVLLARGKPAAAAFAKFDPSDTGGTHFYLSPDAAAIAADPRWTPCDRPSRQQAGSLIVGDQLRVDALFQ